MDIAANRGHQAADASVKNNLPSYLASFVGRERDVRGLKSLLNTSRLITLAERTAEGHVDRIRNKLGVRSRTEVAAWAVEQRLQGDPGG